MKKGMILVGLALVCAVMPSLSVFAADDAAYWGLGLNIGVEGLFNEDYVPGGAEPERAVYQSFGLSPELRMGKFDLTLDLALRFRFDGEDSGDQFEVRKEDWEAGDKWEFLNLYLPKIREAHYGVKGDPFAARFEDLNDMTLGNGFIVSSYTNTLFQPENRLLGAVFDIDGSIVDIPYFGIEVFTANAARFDFTAGRINVRPLAAFTTSILKDLQIGGTMAFDRDPFYFAQRYAMYSGALRSLDDDSMPTVFGLDINVPLVTHPDYSFTVFGDRAKQEGRTGWMGGAEGRLWAFTYEWQSRFLDENFLPAYYDGSYDLYRLERYAVFEGNVPAEETSAYLGSMGLLLFDDKVAFKIVSEGPLDGGAGRLYDWQGVLELKEGLVPFLSFDILYSKKNMADFDDFAAWKQESLIQARFHCHAGPALLSLVYIMRYIPTDTGPDRQALTGIEGRIRLY